MGMPNAWLDKKNKKAGGKKRARCTLKTDLSLTGGSKPY